MSVRICSWKDISFKDAEHLLELSCSNTESLQAFLAGRLGGKEANKQALIELDMFTYAILFCKKNDFSPEQLSVFYTILKSVHSMCISTSYDNMQDTFIYFRDLVQHHSVQRPPFSICLYSLAHVKVITDYVLSTYFKHFKLYKYVFTKRVHLSISLQYSGENIETEMNEVVKDEEEVHIQGGGVEGEDVVTTSTCEERQRELSPEVLRLKNIINSTLITHLNQLKISVEQKMNERENIMTEKVSTLETLASSKNN